MAQVVVTPYGLREVIVTCALLLAVTLRVSEWPTWMLDGCKNAVSRPVSAGVESRLLLNRNKPSTPAWTAVLCMHYHRQNPRAVSAEYASHVALAVAASCQAACDYPNKAVRKDAQSCSLVDLASHLTSAATCCSIHSIELLS
jgi:hypothetical protein